MTLYQLYVLQRFKKMKLYLRRFIGTHFVELEFRVFILFFRPLYYRNIVFSCKKHWYAI